MLVIFFLALIVRLFHLWQISHAPFFQVLTGDARAYDLWARQIAGGDWVGRDVFYQAPLYPYALATLYSVFGRSLTLVRVVQAVGGSLACVLLGLAGSRLFSRRAGVVAGLILAVYPPAIFFDGLLQKTALDSLLICITLWLVSRLVTQPGDGERREWTALGLSIGALCLTRENTVVFVPVILVWIACGLPLAPARRWRMAAAFVAGVSALIVPVAARNYAVGGGVYLTTSQFGPNFYIGNNPAADGTYRALRTGRGTAEFEQVDATEIARQATGRALTPAEVSRYWTGRALDFIVTEPVAWSRLMLRKVRLLVNRVEAVDTDSQESYAEWSLALRAGSIVGHFGVLLPLALIGLWITRNRLEVVWVVPALAATYAASVVAFYVVARYRFPLVPFVALWAAAGVARLPELIRSPRPSVAGLAGPLAAMVTAAVVANWPMLSPAAMQAVGENNLGVALQAEGRGAEALDRFRRAIALDPADASAHVNTGIALQAANRPKEAAEAFASAVAIRPGLGEAHYFLGKTLIDEGRTPEAITQLRLAIPAMPDSLELRTTLGIALASQNQLEEAIALFGEVERRDPAFPNAGWNLGAALSAGGHVGEAIPYLEDAVRRDPANLQARGDLADAHNRRGIAMAGDGNLIEAIGEFKEALRLDAGLVDAQANLSTATTLLAARAERP